MTAKKDVINDIVTLENKGERDEEFIELIDGLEQYIKVRKIDVHETKDLVNLVFVIFASLGISDNEYMEMLNRLNLIQINQMGVVESNGSGIVN